MTGQDVLNLRGIDVESAGDDHVLAATNDIQIPVLVFLGQVTGMQPTMAERRFRFLGPVPIFPHHQRFAHANLASFAALDGLAVPVEECYLTREDRPAAR